MSEGIEQPINYDLNQDVSQDEMHDQANTTSAWQRISFYGSGSEYFRIWIVNLFLTVITLGIYSAWATVRERRYFYGNTEVAGGRFDFHGKPLQILFGRIVALILLIAWTQGANIHISVPFIAIGILGVLFPWFLVKAMSFRLRNTSLRNLRFNFSASLPNTYKVFLAYVMIFFALLAVVSWATVYMIEGVDMTNPESVESSGVLTKMFGIYGVLALGYAFIYPCFVCDIRRFTVTHTGYGESPFSIDLRRSAFVGHFWAAVGLYIAAVFIVGFFAAIIGGIATLVGPSIETNMGGGMVLLGIGVTYLVMGLTYFVAYAYWKIKIFNMTLNNLALENVRFRADMKVMPLTKILVLNALMVLLTLGFAYPWAKVRVMRYSLEAVEYQGDANLFAGMTKPDANAIGDEVGEAFDIEFGF